MAAKRKKTRPRRTRSGDSGTTRGRPTRFRPEYVDIASAMAKNGATDGDIADALGVTTWTISRWQSQHAAICQAIVVPPGAPDDRAERALFQRAIGFEYQESHPIKIKEVTYANGKKVAESERVEIADVNRLLPPDTTAALKWLSNKRPDRWRERQTHELTGRDGKDLIPDASPRPVARAVAEILREAQIAPAEADFTSDPEDAPAANEYNPPSSERRHTGESGAEPPMPRIRTFNPATGRLE